MVVVVAIAIVVGERSEDSGDESGLVEHSDMQMCKWAFNNDNIPHTGSQIRLWVVVVVAIVVGERSEDSGDESGSVEHSDMQMSI